MTDIPEWERQLQQDLAEIRRTSQQLAKAVGGVRGRSEVRGVLVEVDAEGEIVDLQIAPGAMRWTSSQLTAALLDCHRQARADAKAKVKRLLGKADPRIREQLRPLRSELKTSDGQPRPASDEEIQAADDAYFARRNREGWTNTY